MMTMPTKDVCARGAVPPGGQEGTRAARSRGMGYGAVAGVALMLAATAGYGEDWPCWRGPERTGVSQETNWSSAWPAEGPAILWRGSVGVGFSSVSVSRGRLYTAGHQDGSDVVHCFEAGSGKSLWKYSYEAPLDAKYYEGGTSATPTVDGERVYFLSKRGKLCCLEAETGRVVWRRDLAGDLALPVNEWGFASSPVVEKNLILLNVGEAGTAVDKATGELIWTSGRSTAGYASVVPFQIEGRGVAAVFAAKFLVLVETQTGRALWRHPWETGWNNNNADPVVSEGHLFISSYDRGCALLVLGRDGPRVVHAGPSMHNHMNACVKIDGHLYGFNGREGKGRPNDLRCVEYLSGKVVWQREGLGVGSLVAAGRRLILLSETGELVIAQAQPEAFRLLARAQVLGGRCWTPPVLANGRIYCRNARGDLVCLDVVEGNSRSQTR